MKQVNAGLASHLAGEVTTLCNCWRVIRRDGVVLGFTDHDRPFSFDGTGFEAASGFLASSAVQELGLNVESQEVSGALNSERLSGADIRSDRYDGANVELWTVNWAQPEERLLMNVLTIGEIVEEDGAFRAELRSLSADMDETRGRRFSRRCDADLGDVRCGVNLDAPEYTIAANVIGVTGDLVLLLGGLSTFEANWFRGGRIRFASGANLGVSVEIAEHHSGAGGPLVQLWKPFPFPVSPGDSAILTAGCDKSFAACGAKFANALNFRGFPHIPGNDFALGYASSFKVMDGGPIVS